MALEKNIKVPLAFIYKVLKSIPEYSTTLSKTNVHHWRRYDLVANRVLGEIDLCLLKPCKNYKGLCLLVDANCRYLWCAKIKSKQKPDVEKALDEILKKSGHFESKQIIHAKKKDFNDLFSIFQKLLVMVN